MLTVPEWCPFKGNCKQIAEMFNRFPDLYFGESGEVIEGEMDELREDAMQHLGACIRQSEANGRNCCFKPSREDLDHLPPTLAQNISVLMFYSGMLAGFRIQEAQIGKEAFKARMKAAMEFDV